VFYSSACLPTFPDSALISFTLAITANTTGMGLGGLFNFIFPPILGVATLIFFILVNLIWTQQRVRMVVLWICCLLNLYLGLLFIFRWIGFLLIDGMGGALM
jgi:hypothetical protein